MNINCIHCHVYTTQFCQLSKVKFIHTSTINLDYNLSLKRLRVRLTYILFKLTLLLLLSFMIPVKVANLFFYKKSKPKNNLSTLYLTNTLHPTACIIHSRACVIILLYTLHPAPYTVHPAPFTVDTEPSSRYNIIITLPFQY